jgi:hypothetical protein
MFILVILKSLHFDEKVVVSQQQNVEKWIVSQKLTQ